MTVRPDTARLPGAAIGRRPRVVILNDTSVNNGGTAALALLSARLLRDRGHDVDFVAGDEGDDGSLARQGITLVPMGGRQLLDQPPLRGAVDGAWNTRLRDRIARDIRAHDTHDTVYHLHGWAQILSPSVFEALKPVAARTFIHAHDSFLACPNGVYYDFRREEVCTRAPLSAACLSTNCDKRAYAHKVWRSLRHAALRRAFDPAVPWAGVMMINGAMADGLTRAGIPAHLLRTVPNPAAAFCDTRIEAERNRRLAFIGRIEPGKGADILCAAARLAGVPLRVIGDGSARAALARDFPEVEFAGWLPSAEIGARLRDVRALVMPSLFPEPFGLVAAEASRSGLPVVMSRAALLSDTVEEMRLGLAADCRTPAALAAALTRIAQMPADEVRAMSLRGHAAEATFSQTQAGWIDDLLRHYRASLPAHDSRAARPVRPAGRAARICERDRA